MAIGQQIGGRRAGLGSAAGPVLAALAMIAAGARARPAAGARARPAAPPAVSAAAGPSIVDARQLRALRPRYVGPAGVSGRVTAIDVVEAHPETIFAGAADGGVWKSSDAGATWRPVFDAQPAASIGALAVFQANADVVWVGTGEANLHATVGSGDGVYRSTDGGRTWSHLGLTASEHIARIVLHPVNPEVAWVAAVGPLWRQGGERGVYRTEDGGKHWTRVLFVDDATGAGDLALDPGNPERLLANLWQVRRWPWELRSGGPGSGLYLSEDGGRTWRRRTAADGLPAGEVGRMKLAFARSRPEIAYAMVETERAGVLLRSQDGGRTWDQAFRHPNLFPRPFFFGEMKVDPWRPDRLYSLHFCLDVSADGGKHWEYRLFSGVHPDMHALWIDPRDPDHLLIATDGGLYASRDGGQTASPLGELPLAQVNRVAVDLETPYDVYAGTQDNGSWRGPGAGWEAGGVAARRWQMVGGDDGTTVLPDPATPGQGFSIAQNGELVRWDLATGEWRDAQPRLPTAAGGRAALRFGWITPLVLDPFAPGTLYCGSQLVLRSTDRGRSWTAISPDLTTDNPAWQRQDVSGGLTPDVGGAETYTTISAIAPSPLAAGALWVGTDDGRLHLTRDGGATWRSLEALVPGVPAGAWVARILASRFAAGTAYVLFDDHRRGDEQPYVVRTDDFGASWHRLPVTGVRGHALAIEQDPVDPDLLFLGTEAGLWVSLDGGGSWLPWPAGPLSEGGLPPAPVADLVVHPRDHDLVIATRGRGLYVVDDITPLRHLAAAALAEPLHLFPPTAAQQHWRRESTVSDGPGGRGEERPEERPYGALLTFWVGARTLAVPPASTPPSSPSPPAAPSVEIRVADAAGRRVRSFTAPVRPGLNRAVWGLESDTLVRRPRDGGRGELPAAAGPGPEVPPGTYQVALSLGGRESHALVRVVADPRSTSTADDWRTRWAAVRRVEQLRQAAVAAIERLERARADLATLAARASGAAGAGREPAPPAKDAQEAPAGDAAAGAAVEAGLAALEARLRPPLRSPLGVARHDLVERLALLAEALASGMAPPTPAQAGELRDAAAAVAALLEEINRFVAAQVAPLRDRLELRNRDLLAPEPPLVLPPPEGS